MQTTLSAKDLMSEQEAADSLGISLETLYSILDEHVFNQGMLRPANLRFTTSDVLMLSCWVEGRPQRKVVRMPRRG